MSVAVFSVVLYVLQGLLSPVATQEIHASYRYAGCLENYGGFQWSPTHYTDPPGREGLATQLLAKTAPGERKLGCVRKSPPLP